MRRFITEIVATRIKSWVEANYDDLGLLHIRVKSLMCYLNQSSILFSGLESCVGDDLGAFFRAQPTFDGRCCVAWLFSLCRVDKTVFLSCRNSSIFPRDEITAYGDHTKGLVIFLLCVCDGVEV